MDSAELLTEQPQPTPNDQPSVQDMVIADIEARKKVGLERYGTLLQPGNGRDALRDAYEEALDLAVYLRQAIAERDATPTRCSDCGRTARELQPVFEDVDGVNKVVAWLGPTCYRRHLEQLQAAAVGDHVCQRFPVQLPIGDQP